MCSIQPLSAVSNDLPVTSAVVNALPAKASSPSVHNSAGFATGYTGAANHAKVDGVNCCLYASDVGARGPDFSVREKDLDPTAIAKGQLTVSSSNEEAINQLDLSVLPTVEAHSLPPLEAGVNTTELHLTSQPAGPSNLQHSGVTITENSLRDVGQKLDQPEILPHNSIETVSPNNSLPFDDPIMMQFLIPTDSNLIPQDDLPSSSA
ncbi:hypothetical protein F0562_010624 [Nyssa sinensis]|uniref:Uncharacterized protein n=1 Tax=Nyssa sinensis TaxID=561372 RepID=A0A5J5A424_9ASTE|nr:hypothetical protein F0562_010624 [Nyssa sinensis]